MMLNFDAKLINLCEKNVSYPEKVWNTCVFSPKILNNATWKAHFSCTIIQLKPFFQPDCWNDNEVHNTWFCTFRNKAQNDRKWKFPFISVLRYIKQMFSFWVFEIFVSSCKRLHDDVLHISRKPLRAHLAVFFPFIRQKHPVFLQRSIRRFSSSSPFWTRSTLRLATSSVSEATWGIFRSLSPKTSCRAFCMPSSMCQRREAQDNCSKSPHNVLLLFSLLPLL